MRERIKDKMRLEHIAEAIQRLQTHAGNLSEAELQKDVLRYYGIVKNIEIIGEAARMLTEQFKETHPEVGKHGKMIIEYDNISIYEKLILHRPFGPRALLRLHEKGNRRGSRRHARIGEPRGA